MNTIIDLGNALDKGSGTLSLPRMTDDEFYRFCQQNEDLRVERNARGELVLMSPADMWTESRGLDVGADLVFWNRGLETPGITAGSSAGYTLPNGAIRSPDVSWVAADRWKSVPFAVRSPYPPISPDFVIEVMSPSDSLAEALRKMEEYAECGVPLGWLIDHKRRTVCVYRPGQEPLQLVNPQTLSAAPELPGLVADLQRVFAEDTP